MRKVPNAIMQSPDRGWWLCYREALSFPAMGYHLHWMKGPYDTPAQAAKALENWTTERKTRVVG